MIPLRALLSKELRVPFDVPAVFRGNVVIEIDRRNRALRFTGAAVDAFVGIDEHLDPRETAAALGRRNLPQLIERNWPDDAVAWADVDARGIARADVAWTFGMLADDYDPEVEA